VRHKGIGEGRRYFTHTLKKAFDDSGMGGINRRNFEIVAKSLIDHVQITNNDGLGEHLPGATVSYQTIEKNYQPRPGAIKARLDTAYNKYLEEPVLHYTIGTRVTHQIIKNLKDHGFESVTVHASPPDFEPQMQRLNDVPVHQHDWMHQLYSTNLERRLIQAVNTGASSDLRGPSPIAGIAYGVGFGQLPAKQGEEVIDEKLSFE
jgi:hypothetical protein